MIAASPRSVVCLWALLLFAVEHPVSLAAGPKAHLIHISVDGLAATYLPDFFTTAPENYPNFLRLIREGASTLNARCDYDFSETMPNHTSMLLGRPVLQPAGWPDSAHHGFTDNFWSPEQTYHNSGNSNVSYLYSVFDVAHDHGLSTAFFAGKEKLAICYVSYNETNGAPDLMGEDNGQNKVDYAQILDWPMGYDCLALINAVTNYLADHAPNYLFLHIADLDYMGHYTGWGSEQWGSTLADIDRCLGSLFEALARNSDFGIQTTIILTTDHGGGYPYNTHVYPFHPLNYTIPFMVWGPGWPANTDLYRLFANRFDPGAGRPDYNAVQQPLRNGDSGNLALAVLGLPPIPGSSLLPVRGLPQVALNISPTGQGVLVSWPSPSTDFVLESTDNLGSTASWQVISDGIIDDGTQLIYEWTDVLGGPTRFFRLRMN